MKIFVTIFFLFMSSVAWSADDIETIEKKVSRLEVLQKRTSLKEPVLRDSLSTLGKIKERLVSLQDAEAKQIDKLKKDMETLGKPAEKEPADVARKRKELKQLSIDHENRLSRVRLLLLKVDEAIRVFSNRHARILKRRLMARTTDVITLIKSGLTESKHWIEGLKKVAGQPVGLKKGASGNVVYIFIVATLVLLVSLFASKKLILLARSRDWGEYFSDTIACAAAISVSRWFPLILTSGVIALGLYLVSDHTLEHVSHYLLFVYGLPALFSLLAVVEFLLVPREPAHSFLIDTRKIACSVSRRINAFILLLFAAFIMFSSSMKTAMTTDMYYFVRAVFSVLFFIVLISMFRVMGRIPNLGKLSLLRVILVFAVFIGMLAELTGHRNLSSAVFRITIGTSIAYGMLMFFRALFSDIYNGLEGGDRNWQVMLRRVMGIRDGAKLSWIPWMRFLTGILLWSAFFYAMLLIIGFSESTLQQILHAVREGFKVGSLTIVPERIFWAIVAFFLLYLFSSWLKVRFEKHMQRSGRIERGTREAIVTMIGYTGAIIATLVALGISGFTFTNLAIIAGALSVGIGFGLQNIVNNFVSGLILLFERPVKTGDWIVVGNTEGYVKKIRIRSTQIETFDRADVVVPNSDLISNQVTNWMLYNMTGRITIKVGVAYGSDTQLVKEVLTRVAEEHTSVISNNRDEYPIRVLFLAFGDSSLDFELRCFIRNIDKRLQVISDLNFAIDREFRSNGIAIPFPQRDVHIKSDDVGGSLPDTPDDKQGT